MVLGVLGLLARRRARLCRSFFVYLLVLIVGNLLTNVFPERFHTHAFWTLKNAIYHALQALVALELALLTFSALPRARLRVELLLASVLVVALVAGLLPEFTSYPYLAVLGFVAPREEATSLWLFVAVLAAATWYRAPVHPFHRKILLAFTLYLGLETFLLKLVGMAAASRPAYLAAYAYLEALDPLAFAVTAGFWTWAAWRPEPVTALSPAVSSRLQPWAAT
jgi:hypothetical protein